MQMCTGTRLTTAIYRRSPPDFFLREEGSLYTGLKETIPEENAVK